MDDAGAGAGADVKWMTQKPGPRPGSASPVTAERTAASAPQRNTVERSRWPAVRKPAVPYENRMGAALLAAAGGGGYSAATATNRATSMVVMICTLVRESGGVCVRLGGRGDRCRSVRATCVPDAAELLPDSRRGLGFYYPKKVPFRV